MNKYLILGLLLSVTIAKGQFINSYSNPLAIVDAVTPLNPSASNNNVYRTLVQWTEMSDVLNNFNPTTGIFNVPTTGQYSINGQLTISPQLWAGGDFISLAIHKNGVEIAESRYTVLNSVGSPREIQLAINKIVTFNAGDLVALAYRNNTSITTISTNLSNLINHFSIHQIK